MKFRNYRRRQSFADKKCYKSVQINFSGKIQTIERFKFFYLILECNIYFGFTAYIVAALL